MTGSRFSLSRRSNGVWYVIVSEEGKPRRWKSTGCTNKAQALAAHTDIQTNPNSTTFTTRNRKDRLSNFT